MPHPKQVNKQSGPPLQPVNTREARHTMLFYGAARTGKTHLAADAHNVHGMGPAVLIGFGSGYATVIDEPRFDGITVYTPKTVDELSALFNWLRPDTDNDGSGQNALAEYGWNTVVVDELDSLYTMLMRERMADVIAEKPERNENKPALDDYGIIRLQMLNIVDNFLKLPVHVAMTAWAEFSKEELSGKIFILPSLSGKLAGEIPGKFSIFSYLEITTPRTLGPNRGQQPSIGTRLAHFQNDGKALSGVWGETRQERLGVEIENPTMQKIYDLLQGAN